MIANYFKLFLVFSFLLLQASGALAAPCKEQAKLYSRASELFQSRQFLLSSIHFSALSTNDCDEKLAARAAFSYSLSLVELGETSEALRNLNQLEQNPDLETSKRARLFHAFLIPEFGTKTSPDEQTRLRLWSERKSPQELQAYAEKATLDAETSRRLKQISADIVNLPTKSPALAGGLSALIPGLGQAYTGTFQSAAIALLLNSLFLATTVEFANKKLPMAAVASGTIFSVTYFGNILNAVDSAHQRNQSAVSPHEQELKQVLFPEFRP